MKIKHATDISTIQELDYHGTRSCPTALTAHLLARIARRPGRWRQRMQSRCLRSDEELRFYDDAA